MVGIGESEFDVRVREDAALPRFLYWDKDGAFGSISIIVEECSGSIVLPNAASPIFFEVDGFEQYSDCSAIPTDPDDWPQLSFTSEFGEVITFTPS